MFEGVVMVEVVEVVELVGRAGVVEFEDVWASDADETELAAAEASLGGALEVAAAAESVDLPVSKALVSVSVSPGAKLD